MKVMLIKPPMLVQRDWSGVIGRSVPLSLGYIAATLEENGDDVRILDASIEEWDKLHDWIWSRFADGPRKYTGMSFESITDRVRKEDPDFVGITGLSVEARPMYRTAAAVKRAKDIPVVLGGPHVTARYHEALSDPNVDFVCLGEGEYLIKELVEELKKGNANFSKIKGLGWKDKDGKIVVNEKRPPITDLDALPFPSRHLFNLRKYKEAAKHLQSSRQALVESASIITSRGCPFNCVFCSIDLTMGRVWRPRSPESVAAEIEHVMKQFGVQHVEFEDDNLTLVPGRFEKVLDICKERGLKFTWNTPNGVRADTLSEHLAKRFKESGCVELTVAPESGSQRVIDDVIGKKLKLEAVENAVRWCVKYGIEIAAFYVIGMIGETKEDLEQTYQHAQKMRKMGCKIVCYIALPYYETRLYRMAREKNYLLLPDGEELEYAFLNRDATIETPEFDSEYLYELEARVGGYDELGRIWKIIRTDPIIAAKFFATHPVLSTKHLLGKYVLRAFKNRSTEKPKRSHRNAA
jgi:magnesium-protoporphyrin IX monomethyl ester (oxidative) cyclase